MLFIVFLDNATGSCLIIYNASIQCVEILHITICIIYNIKVLLFEVDNTLYSNCYLQYRCQDSYYITRWFQTTEFDKTSGVVI